MPSVLFYFIRSQTVLNIGTFFDILTQNPLLKATQFIAITKILLLKPIKDQVWYDQAEVKFYWNKEKTWLE